MLARVEKAGTVLAVKDLRIRSLVPASPDQEAAPEAAAAARLSVGVQRASVWASSTRLFIVTALVSNLRDLGHLIDRRSSDTEVLKVPKVIYKIYICI